MLAGDLEGHLGMNDLRHIFSRTASVVVSLSCLWASGCGPDGPPRFAISGQVFYDGQPVNHGNIGFIAAEAGAGKSVGGDVVAGRYEFPRYEGPQAGSYKVVIYAERPSGRKLQADEGSSEMVDELVQYIPEIYNVKTTLSVDVSGDRDDLNFLLEKPKRTTRRGR
jgi:hypothetical protein